MGFIIWEIAFFLSEKKIFLLDINSKILYLLILINLKERGWENVRALGRHILAEFYSCEKEILNDVEKIKKIMVEASNVIKATVVNQSFHKFEPHGVSGVVVIAESHLSIHTWPEYNFASVDVYTCGNKIDPWIAYEYLNKELNAGGSNVLEVKRGIITSENATIKHKPGED